MKPLKPHRQTEGMCGPASLKILLSHYGKEFTQQELATLCRSTAESGTDHQGIIDAVESIGNKPIVKENASLDELRYFIERDTPVIVGWWSDDGDHYSVVYEISEDRIFMMDPQEDLGTTEMSIEEFEKLWYDFDGPENVRVDRWMLAIPAF